MDLIRDVLDQLVVDRNGRIMGRVDGILLEESRGAPRCAAILIGPAALGDRLHPVLGRWVRSVERWFGLDDDRPVRIPFSDIDRIDERVHVTLAIGDTAVSAVERRLRRWIRRLPGAG